MGGEILEIGRLIAVIASEAKQSMPPARQAEWIASSRRFSQ
jgi:hypothetical protein